MWSPFQNKGAFELGRWLIDANVAMDDIDRYFKEELGPEGRRISFAYWLLEAVDKWETGIGMKSRKKGFVSFSETVC